MNKVKVLPIINFAAIFAIILASWSNWNSATNRLLPNSTIGDGSGVATIKDNAKFINKVAINSNTPNFSYPFELYSSGNNTIPFILYNSDGSALSVIKQNSSGNGQFDLRRGGSGAVGAFITSYGVSYLLYSSLGIGANSGPSSTDRVIFFGDNGVDPALTGGVSAIYSKSVTGTLEVFAIDGAGNVTQISPHDPETGEWVFFSKNVKTGRVVKIHMEELMFDLAKEMSRKTGKKYIEEWQE